MVGYVRLRTADIVDGEIIEAADINDELDGVAGAFGTDGHTHDGTAGNGPALDVNAATTGTLDNSRLPADISVTTLNASDAATTRSNLGLGTGDTVEFTDLTVSGTLTAANVADPNISGLAFNGTTVVEAQTDGVAISDSTGASPQVSFENNTGTELASIGVAGNTLVVNHEVEGIQLNYQGTARFLTTNNGATVNGSLSINGTSSSGIFNADNDTVLILAGGTGTSSGANYLAYSPNHGSQANDHMWRSGSTAILQWDDSATQWNFQDMDVTNVANFSADNVAIGVSLQSANFTAEGNGDTHSVDTTTTAITVTAPSSGIFTVSDGTNNASVNNITVDFGSESFEGMAGEDFIIDLNSLTITFFYTGTTWRII